MTKGLLIAFEGLDQSGKQTQAEGLRDHLAALGRECRAAVVSRLLDADRQPRSARGLHGEREYGPDVMQLLYVANRHEKKPEIERALAAGVTIVCDRYIASSIAYGEAHGLDRGMADRDSAIPAAAGPQHPARHRSRNRGAAEGGRTRPVRARSRAACRACAQSYHRQAAASTSWLRLDGERSARRRPRGRAHGSRDTTRAAVSARTSRAPGPRSTTRARLQRRAGGATHRPRAALSAHRPRARSRSAKASRTFACRRAAGRSVCDDVARVRRSTFFQSRPRCRASSSAWLKPRARRRRRCSGTGTTRFTPPARSPALAIISARQRTLRATDASRTSVRGG